MGKTRDGVVVSGLCKLYDLHLDYIEDRTSRFISIVDETVKKNGCDKMVFPFGHSHYRDAKTNQKIHIRTPINQSEPKPYTDGSS